MTYFRSEIGACNKMEEHEIQAEDDGGPSRDIPEQVEPRATHNSHSFATIKEKAKLTPL